MASELDKAIGGFLDKGINAYDVSLSPEVFFDVDGTFNVTSGINRGVGPRYGFSTLPGHADQEQVTAPAVMGVARSESTGAAGERGLAKRLKFYAVIPIKVGSYSDPTAKITAYLWYVSSDESTFNSLNLVFSTVFQSSDYQHTANFTDGLARDSRRLISDSAAPWEAVAELVPAERSGALAKASAVLDYTGVTNLNLNYLSVATLSVSGQDNPAKWLFGVNTTAGDATHAPNVSFWRNTSISIVFPVTINNILCGVTPEFNLGNYKKDTRQMKFYCLNAGGNWNNIDYRASFVPTTSRFFSTPNYETTKNIDVSAVTATKETSGTGYSNTKGVLVNDDAMVCNSQYQAILSAPGKAQCCIIQDWLRMSNGPMQQYVDLVNNPIYPKAREASTAFNGDVVPSCFDQWEAFVPGTPSTLLGAANSGVLRKNTVYEFTFSYFNKRLNFESNVGKPIKFQTDSDDFVAIKIFEEVTVLGTTFYTPFSYISGAIGPRPIPFVYDSPDYLHMNYLEYRFYYRAEGSYEWLPALFIDAAKYWFYPHHGVLYACQAAIAGLPGGQPGGFSDYSRLPDQPYNHVLTYKSRAWWFSPQSISISLKNNVFAYATRNSVSIPDSEIRGGIVHNYPGQAEQTSRLLIFSNKQVYVARYTGQLSQVPVQISADVTATFDLEGSDLNIDPWTTDTAFSHRAAVVAEGIAYWWGPTGIIRDSGIDTPKKISEHLEPDLFSLYDPNDTANIHCSYNAKTKEITWFFKPRTADGYLTHGLVYDIIDAEFLPVKFAGKIDHTFPVEIQGSSDLYGSRKIAVVRNTENATLQRPYFFDERNRAGDMRPTTDMVVKTIASIGTNQVRLTMAAGYDASNLATIAANDYIAMQQVSKYYSSGTHNDMLAKVLAVGTGTVDIQIPDGTTFAAGSPTQAQYFPIWHRAAATAGLNGFAWQIKTNYWMPKGVNYSGIWCWLYMLHKLNLLPSVDDQSYTVAYRSPQSVSSGSDSVDYVNNSDGHWQLYHPLATGEGSNQGQAMKLTWSGIQIASELVLQYFELHGMKEMGELLKTFEG